VRLTTTPPSCAECHENLNLLEPSGPHRACYGTALPLHLCVDVDALSLTVTLTFGSQSNVLSLPVSVHRDESENTSDALEIRYLFVVRMRWDVGAKFNDILRICLNSRWHETMHVLSETVCLQVFGESSVGWVAGVPATVWKISAHSVERTRKETIWNEDRALQTKSNRANPRWF